MSMPGSTLRNSIPQEKLPVHKLSGDILLRELYQGCLTVWHRGPTAQGKGAVVKVGTHLLCCPFTMLWQNLVRTASTECNRRCGSLAFSLSVAIQTGLAQGTGSRGLQEAGVQGGSGHPAEEWGKASQVCPFWSHFGNKSLFQGYTSI